MNPELLKQLKRIVTLSLLAMLIGWLAGSVSWALAITFGGLLGWHLYQMFRLQHWLESSDNSEVPESKGAWGLLFDTLYRKERQHRASEANLKSILNRVQESTTALKDGVLMIDAQGNIEWWNRAAKALLGLQRPSDVGQPVINLVRDPRFIRYFERRLYVEALEIPSPINDNVFLQYTITEFGRSERLLLIRDVTRLHRLERMRQDFVGNASHELRTPLTVIRGYLETLQEQFADQNPGLLRALKSMEAQALRMGNLVTDMLMLSRLETTDSLSDELPIDIESMLKEIHENARHLQAEKEHRFSLEVEPGYLLMGQEKELVSAFSNLVYNAVKYTPAGGSIDIRWRVDESGGHYSVSDNGIGIDPVHINRLTERFYRVDDGRSSAQGGTGLGLAIVKHVLLRHNATLQVESRPGKGSTFSCHFPPSMLRPLPEAQDN